MSLVPSRESLEAADLDAVADLLELFGSGNWPSGEDAGARMIEAGYRVADVEVAKVFIDPWCSLPGWFREQASKRRNSAADPW